MSGTKFLVGAEMIAFNKQARALYAGTEGGMSMDKPTLKSYLAPELIEIEPDELNINLKGGYKKCAEVYLKPRVDAVVGALQLKVKHLEAFVKLYLCTYADTDTHPTAMQESEVVQRARVIVQLQELEKR